MSATASSKKRRSLSKEASNPESSVVPQLMKLTQTQKRKRRRRVAKQKKKQPEIKAQPTCLRIVLSAGKFCNLVGSALVAPFKSILRINSLEKQILVLQEQISQLQRAEKKRRGKRAAKPVTLSTQSDVVEETNASNESIPIPPPMDDAPPPPPMDGPEGEGPPPPPPMTPEGQKVQPVKLAPKVHPSEGKKEATGSVGVTLADITNVKLRKASVPQVKPDGMGGGITKEDILGIKLRKNSTASQDGKSLGPGGLNLEEIKGFKLKRTQNKSPGGTPRKSRRQVTSPDEGTRAAAYAALAGGEGTASTQHAFAALRKKFLSSPRGAAALQKTQDVGSNNNEKENLMTPANTHGCWTPATTTLPLPSLLQTRTSVHNSTNIGIKKSPINTVTKKSPNTQLQKGLRPSVLFGSVEQLQSVS